MKRSYRSALGLALVAGAAVIFVSASAASAANERIVRHASPGFAPARSAMHVRPMRPPVVRVPRVHAPRFRPPRARLRAQRLRIPRADVPRAYLRRPAAMPVVRPIMPVQVRGVPAPNLGSVRRVNFSPGVPSPQLRRGTPAPRAGGVPPPNLFGAAHTKPGGGAVTGLVAVGHRHVPIFRGQRYVHYHGRWRRIRPVTALAAPIAIIVIAGASYYADGYLDLPAPACAGVTDAGCELGMANVAADDGDAVPQCLQYCPWDATGQTAALATPAAPEPTRSVDIEPITRVGGDSTPEAIVAPPPPAAAPASETAKIYAISLQSAPDAGGKCVDLPDGKASQGTALQLMPCTGASAQAFAYDAGKKSLAAGGLCVDAGSGAAPNTPLRLAACSGGPSQTWYIRQNGDYVEFVGIDGLCIDAASAATQAGAPLMAATCHGEAKQSWTMHAAQPGTNEAAK